MKVFYTEIPEKIKYMLQKDGHADVWLRKNITKYSHDELEDTKSSGYFADEVYINTRLSYDQVDEQFDDLFENGSIVYEDVTIEERVDAIEEAILELLGGE